MSDICSICNKPIESGQGYYSLPDKNGQYRHYDCWVRERGPRVTREDFDKSMKKLREAIARVRSKL